MWKKYRTRLFHLHTISGFTLIEVLIALAIMVIGLVPLLHLLTTSILMTDSAWNLSQATLIGNSKLVEVISQNDLSIGLKKGSVEIKEKEIIFDWQSEVDEVYIKELEDANLDDLHKVVVTVTWQEGLNPKQIYLTTYVYVDKTVTTSNTI
jgi:prepilin-type N-terminal cleavage/methylation domain-containing protein